MSALQALVDYVLEHSVRGSCRCGLCVDAPEVAQQPSGHTVDMVFFKVANNGGEADKFQELVTAVRQEVSAAGLCECLLSAVLRGEEVGFIALGGWLGDQGLAMQLMGLGALLGAWELLTPVSMEMPEELWLPMAQSGLISIQAKRAPMLETWYVG